MSRARIVVTDKVYDLSIPSGTPANLELFFKEGRVWSRIETDQNDIDVTVELYEIHFIADRSLSMYECVVLDGKDVSIEDLIVEQIKMFASSPIPKIRLVSSDGMMALSRLYDGETGREIIWYYDLKISPTGTLRHLTGSLTINIPCGQYFERILSRVGSERIMYSRADEDIIYFKDRMRPQTWHEYVLMKAVESTAATGV